MEKIDFGKIMIHISNTMSPAIAKLPTELVIAAVADQLCFEPEDIKPEHHLYDDLGADSMDMAEISMMIESGLGKSIDTEPFLQAKTVAELISEAEIAAAF